MSYLISWVKVKLKQLSQIMRCQAKQTRPWRDLKAFFLTEEKQRIFQIQNKGFNLSISVPPKISVGGGENGKSELTKQREKKSFIVQHTSLKISHSQLPSYHWLKTEQSKTKTKAKQKPKQNIF